MCGRGKKNNFVSDCHRKADFARDLAPEDQGPCRDGTQVRLQLAGSSQYDSYYLVRACVRHLFVRPDSGNDFKLLEFVKKQLAHLVSEWLPN